MFEKIFNNMLHEDEESIQAADLHYKNSSETEPAPTAKKWDIRTLITSAVILITALATRLYDLFFITNPVNAGAENWYSDVYHHWQIAYLSQQIGFNEGFLRLWDLKGLEYFWGLMHPLTGAVLIWLTGSTSIILFRIMALTCGSIALVFLFLAVKKYWGYHSALAATLIGVFNPVGIFSDASGMVEPMGIMFMLAGIYFIDLAPVLGGFLLALAAATRAEYWILSAFIVGVILIFRHNIKKNISFFVGYLVPVLLYMKYLLDYTGNPIYPVWWNYLGNAAGAWQAKIPPTAEQLFIRNVYIAIVIVSFAGLVWAIKTGKRQMPILLFGFGNWLMWGVTIGLTKYLLSYLPRFWVDRIMIWPYLFLGTMISVTLFYYIPRIKHSVLRAFAHSFSWLTVIMVIFLSQILWKPIMYYYDSTVRPWESDRILGETVGKSVGPEGKVLIPEFWPPVTYSLVNYGNVKGSRLVGHMFDPYFYISGDPYLDWGNNRKTVLSWLKKDDIRYVFFTKDEKRYVELINREPEAFSLIKSIPESGIFVYKINLENIAI